MSKFNFWPARCSLPLPEEGDMICIRRHHDGHPSWSALLCFSTTVVILDLRYCTFFSLISTALISSPRIPLRSLMLHPGASSSLLRSLPLDAVIDRILTEVWIEPSVAL